MENVTEGNKLIAEFMGGKLSRFSITNKEFFMNLPFGRTIIFEDIKYHSSWEWLMPVVEKIEALYNGCLQVIIKDTRCHIDVDPQGKIQFLTN